MAICRELAIRILKYLDEHPDFYFPFLVMNQEYAEKDDDFVEIEPNEWQMIAEDDKYQTFELWENVEHLFAETIELMSKGFIEKINDDSGIDSVTFKIEKEEVEQKAERKLTDAELKEVFTAIENDPVLWKEIERSIIAAVDFYTKRE